MKAIILALLVIVGSCVCGGCRDYDRPATQSEINQLNSLKQERFSYEAKQKSNREAIMRYDATQQALSGQ